VLEGQRDEVVRLREGLEANPVLDGPAPQLFDERRLEDAFGLVLGKERDEGVFRVTEVLKG